MQRTNSNPRLRPLLLLAKSVGLFAVFYYYVYLRIHPDLFYLQRPHVFLFDSHFFYGMVGHPGGVVDYASAFLSPLLAWNWLGALVVALLVAIVCWATRGTFAAVAGAGGEFVYLLPAVLILMLLGCYIHPVRLCVGLSIVLLGANLYARLGGCRVAARLAAFAIASLAVYFAAAGLYAIFACLCGCYEWSVKRQRWLGVACGLCAVAVPYAMSWWPFDLIFSDAFRGLFLPQGEHWLAVPSPKAVAIHTAVLVFPLLATLVLAWLRKPAAQTPPIPQDANGETVATADEPEPGSWKVRLTVPVAMLLLVVLADLAAFDSPKRCLFEIENNSELQRWDEVLVWAEKLPPQDARGYDPQTLYCINRALFFQGGLLESMFEYPQVLSIPSLTLIHKDIDTTARLTPRQCSEIFFDLGRINESEQMAYEALEECGDRPEVLKRLVLIYAIKGQPEAAERFLLLLERSLLHRGWARQVRRQLDSDPALSGMALVTWHREMAVQRDSLGNASNLTLLLEGLLERNPRNRMALEYLMAHYLLTRQIDKLAADCRRFDGLDYARLPRHVEEALACYMMMTGQEDLDLGSRSIRPETWQQFAKFIEVQRQTKDDPQTAFAALYPDFHDTYFFSFVFGHNIASLGVVKSPD